MDTLASTMTDTSSSIDRSLYDCHIDNFNKQFPKRPNFCDASSQERKMSNSISIKEQLRRNSMSASQNVHFKEFKMDGAISYGISTDRYRSNFPIDPKDDNPKSNIPKPVNLHVSSNIFSSQSEKMGNCKLSLSNEKANEFFIIFKFPEKASMEYLQHGNSVISWKWTLSQLDALSSYVDYCAIELLQLHPSITFNYVCFILYKMVSLLQNLSIITLDGDVGSVQKS